MYIYIDDTLPDLTDAVVEEIRRTRPDDVVLRGHGTPELYAPVSGIHLVSLKADTGAPTHSSPGSREMDIRLAGQGARVWGGTPDLLSPTYAGSTDDPDEIIRDAVYAEQRAAYYRSFKLHYIGRTYVSPRYVVVADNVEDVKTILRNIPVGDELSPWSNAGFVVVEDLRSLRKFVDDHFDVNFLAYSTKNKNRLKKIGIDFGELPKVEDTVAYGVTVRSTSALMRPFEVSQ